MQRMWIPMHRGTEERVNDWSDMKLKLFFNSMALNWQHIMVKNSMEYAYRDL